MTSTRRATRPIAAATALLCAGMLGLWIAAARGGGPSITPVDRTIGDLLSGIDYVPTRAELDAVLGADSEARLIAVAQGADRDLGSPGQRIRAYRALALYPTSSTRHALGLALASYGGIRTGVATLYLRSAMASLVIAAGPDAIDPIVPLLKHPSLDVRADAARALGLTHSPRAIEPLSRQQLVEASSQVQLAITEALRILQGTTAGTN